MALKSHDAVCFCLPEQRWQRTADSLVRPDAGEEAATGNGESETFAGTHPQTRAYEERAGV